MLKKMAAPFRRLLLPVVAITVNDECWYGDFDAERCCVQRDEQCWDSFFTYEVCCLDMAPVDQTGRRSSQARPFSLSWLRALRTRALQWARDGSVSLDFLEQYGVLLRFRELAAERCPVALAFGLLLRVEEKAPLVAPAKREELLGEYVTALHRAANASGLDECAYAKWPMAAAWARAAAALSSQDAPARVRVVMPICNAREEKEAAAWLPNLTAPGVDLHFVQKSC